MRTWIRRSGAALGFVLLVGSALLYFLAGLVLHSSMILALWTGWAVIFGLSLVWRRRPILVLLCPVIAIVFLTVVIIVSGLIFGRPQQPVH